MVDRNVALRQLKVLNRNSIMSERISVRLAWMRFSRMGYVMALVCVLSVTGCSSVSTATSPAAKEPVAAKDHVVKVSNESLLLVPPEEAGEAGWCLNTGSRHVSGCGLYTRTRPPIVAETWSSGGAGPTELVRGDALVTGEVAYVVLMGQRIPTRPKPILPDGLRQLIVEFQGKGPGDGEPFPRLRPLNALGHTLRERRGQPLHVRVEPIRFSDASHPPAGACRIEAQPFRGLVVGGGSVVASVGPYRGLIGQAFQACADSSYAIGGQHLLVTVLLSAAHPGSTPAPLPAAAPLPGHPGVFSEPDVRDGETLARRVAGAWIDVSEGENKQQRLTLLEHVKARV
jgi:hypothetical protein